MSEVQSKAEPRGWILFDGECGVCRTVVPRWERVLASRGFETVSLHEPWVIERVGGRLEDLLTDMRLLFADGRILTGADAYRFVMRDVWWLRPAYWISRLPIASWIFDACYRRFADNRHVISRACGLDGKPIE